MPTKKQSVCKRTRGKSKQTSLLDFEPQTRRRREAGSSAVASAPADRGASSRRASSPSRTGSNVEECRSVAAALPRHGSDGQLEVRALKPASKKRDRPHQTSSANRASSKTIANGACAKQSGNDKSAPVSSSKKRSRPQPNAAAASNAALATAATFSENDDWSSDKQAAAKAMGIESTGPPRKKRVTVVCDVTVAERKGKTSTTKRQTKKGISDVHMDSGVECQVTPSPELPDERGELASSFFPEGRDAAFGSTFDGGKLVYDDETASLPDVETASNPHIDIDEETGGHGVGGTVVSKENAETIESKALALQSILTPAFHQPWHQPYQPVASPLPPGVVDIDVFTHRCCDHSLLSHAGYSWLTSKRRCGCTKDSNHNSSESMSESYLGSYGVERYSDVGMSGLKRDRVGGSTARVNEADWRAEAWWLDQTRREREAASRIASTMSESPQDRLQLLPTSVAEHLDYMPRQPRITVEMRAILTDWLCEVSMEYSLSVETFWLSVALVDRSLACSYGKGQPGGKRKRKKGEANVIGGEMLVAKDKVQLVGCACTMIASKMLEVAVPTVDDFVYISDKSYSRQEILDMESRIASALRFNLNIRTPYYYVDRFLRASYASSECSTLGSHDASVVMGGGANSATNALLKRMVHYLLDLSVLEYKLVSQKPSLVAASAVYLGRATLGIRQPTDSELQRTQNGFWSETLEYYTGYDLFDLEECVRLLHRLQEGAEDRKLKTIYKKHKDKKHGRVALRIVLNENDLGFL